MRPIGARALKSAIDTLRPWLADARVLDLYAGQGRFGLSALEEGAREVTFVEKDAGMARELKKAGAKDVAAQDSLIFLDESKEEFDIVFADPPFELWTPQFSTRLFASVAHRLASPAIFLVKHPSRVLPSLTFQGFLHWKTTPFGESQLIYFRYGQSNP